MIRSRNSPPPRSSLPLSDTPRLDAELLMAHALGVARSELLLRHLDDPVPAAFSPPPAPPRA
jgi:release factor glutamine methyltransferase